jgi:hypothetical protein
MVELAAGRVAPREHSGMTSHARTWRHATIAMSRFAYIAMSMTSYIAMSVPLA